MMKSKQLKATEAPEQLSLEDLLDGEGAIEYEFNAALPLKLINAPEDAPEPSARFLASVKRRGVYEPLLLQRAARGRYDVISGRRRYRAAEIAGLETVPAIITALSAEHREALTIKLNRERADNPVADVLALSKLSARGYSDEDIAKETSLTKQEIAARRRFGLADPRIRSALLAGKCSVAVAEAAAKLPPAQQKMLMEKFQAEGAERLTMEDVAAVKSARTQAAIASLPESLFMSEMLSLPESGSETELRADDDPHAWLHRFAGELWETLLELKASGIFTHRNNAQARRAVAEAEQLINTIRQVELAGSQEGDSDDNDSK